MLDCENLAGKCFLDSGSGSGLSASPPADRGPRVHYFNYDPHSDTCTAGLKRSYFPKDTA